MYSQSSILWVAGSWIVMYTIDRPHNSLQATLNTRSVCASHVRFMVPRISISCRVIFHQQSALFRLFIDIISSSVCLHHVFRYTSCMSCGSRIVRTCVFFAMTYSYVKRNKSIPVTFGFATNINFVQWIIHWSSWLSIVIRPLIVNET